MSIKAPGTPPPIGPVIPSAYKMAGPHNNGNKPDAYRSAVRADFVYKAIADISNSIQTFQNAYIKQYGDGDQPIYNEQNWIAKALIPFKKLRENPTDPDNKDSLALLAGSSKIIAGAITVYRYSTMVRKLSTQVKNLPDHLSPERVLGYKIKTYGEIVRAGSMIADTTFFFGGWGLMASGHVDLALYSYLVANAFRLGTSIALVSTNPFAYMDAVREDKERLENDPDAAPQNVELENRAVQLTFAGAGMTWMQSAVLFTIATEWATSDSATLIATMESASANISWGTSLAIGLLQVGGPVYAIRKNIKAYRGNSGEVRNAYRNGLTGALFEMGGNLLYSWPQYRFTAHFLSAIAQGFKARSMQLIDRTKNNSK